jgi:DNA-binding SARP family transcriptional activator
MSLTITTFGPFAVQDETGKVTVSRHAAALLALLVSKQGQLFERAALADLLWKVGSAARRRHSLSQLVYALRRQIPPGCLHVRRDSLAIDTARVRSDYHCLITAAHDQHTLVIETYMGTFLDGFPYITDAFDDWRLATAATIELLVEHAYQSLLDEALDKGDFARASNVAKRCLNLFPHNERMARMRIEALAQAGAVSEALRECEFLRRQFTANTGYEPQLITEDLVARIARLPALLDERTHGRVYTSIVGRRGVIDKLIRHWKGIDEGCRIASVIGEAGIGKSRIMQHVVRKTVLDGARPFVFACSEVETALPYSGVVGLIRDGIRPAELSHLHPRWRSALGTLAPELFASDNVHAYEPKRILWESVAQLFEVLCRGGPITIAVDDYHLMDESSREMLTYVAQRLADRRVFFLFAGRRPIAVSAFENESSVVMSVHVHQLMDDDVEQLFDECEVKINVRIDPATRTLLRETIGGRPLFLLEALRQFQDAGGQIEGDFIGRLISSGSLADYMARRIGSYSVHARSLAAAASVMNREASLHLLARAARIPSLAAAEAVSELVAEGVLSDTGRLRFSHDLMRVAVYENMSTAERVMWHQRLATALIATQAGSANEVALHFEQAGDTIKAYEWSRRAAKDAERLHAYLDAEEQHRRVIRCAPPSKQSDAYTEFVQFVLKSGRYAALVPYLHKLSAILRSTHGDGAVAIALAGFSAREEQGQVDAGALMLEAQDILYLAERNSPSHISTVLWHVAEHVKLAGDPDLLRRFSEALEVHSGVASDEVSAEMLSMAALLRATSVGYLQARDLANRAVSMSTDTGNPLTLARALFARGTVRLWGGELRDAASDYEGAVSAADQSGPDRLIQVLQANYAVVLMECGLFDEAERMALIALRESTTPRRAYSFGNLALISLKSGEQDAAIRYGSAMLEVHKTFPQCWIPVHAEAIIGLAELDSGRSAAAIPRARLVAEVLSAGPRLDDPSHLHLFCARVEQITGRSGPAIERLTTAAANLDSRDFVGSSRLILESARMQPAVSGELRNTISYIHARATADGARLLANEALHMKNQLSC